MSQEFRVRASALIVENDDILLIQYYTDSTGVHYNLPGGGVDPGESVLEAVVREASEEAGVTVEVGPLALVYEYEPLRNNVKFGLKHHVHFIFACTRHPSTEPGMPTIPDAYQTGVRWVPLDRLHSVELWPKITSHILDYVAQQKTIFVEETEVSSNNYGEETA